MAYTNDLIASKLIAHYDADPDLTGETFGSALLIQYRIDEGLEGWEEYVAHVASASTSRDVNDDVNAFWDAFVP